MDTKFSSLSSMAGLEIKLFFQGDQLLLQKLPKDVLYRKRYIFGLPAAIEGVVREFKVARGSWQPLISSHVWISRFIQICLLRPLISEDYIKYQLTCQFISQFSLANKCCVVFKPANWYVDQIMIKYSHEN